MYIWFWTHFQLNLWIYYNFRNCENDAHTLMSLFLWILQRIWSVRIRVPQSVTNPYRIISVLDWCPLPRSFVQLGFAYFAKTIFNTNYCSASFPFDYHCMIVHPTNFCVRDQGILKGNQGNSSRSKGITTTNRSKPQFSSLTNSWLGGSPSQKYNQLLDFVISVRIVYLTGHLTTNLSLLRHIPS